MDQEINSFHFDHEQKDQRYYLFLVIYSDFYCSNTSNIINQDQPSDSLNISSSTKYDNFQVFLA